MTTATARPYIHPREVVKDLRPSDVAGARVLLINMPLREGAAPNCAPTGPALLAGRLRAWGAEAALVDLNAYRIHGDMSMAHLGRGEHALTPTHAIRLILAAAYKLGQPDVIGLSGIITTLKWQKRIANICRDAFPDALIVTGNGLATEFREGLFDWVPELDGVAHSEGDLSIVKIAADGLAMRRLGVRGAINAGVLRPYMVGEVNGRPRFVYDGGRPDDLDDAPLPAYDLLETDALGGRPLETYLANPVWGMAAGNSSAAPFSMKRSLNTVSSRGCPFACKFCFRGATGERNYGVRTSGSLAAEMRHYVERYKVDFIGVLDDNALVSRQRIADMVNGVGDLCRETGLRWGTHGRLDEAADLKPVTSGSAFNAPLRVDMMHRAGCVYIGFGAESASKRTLEFMGKGGFILSNGTTRLNGFDFPTTMVEGVKNTKRAGIHANLTWIAGYPGEHLEDLKTTIAFIQWQREYYASCGDGADSVNEQLFTATYYPGTEMGKSPKVQHVLNESFGLNFDDAGQPICDSALERYVLELDDATKILTGRDGKPVYYGDMTIGQFLKCRELIDAGRTMDILGL